MEKKILNQLCISEYEIIGSYADKNINRDVVSDIDTQDIEIFNNDDITTYNKILEHFRDIFKKYKDDKRVVITDFKCGVDNANVPIRWKYNDIMRGYTYLDNNKKAYFIDQLQKHSIIKIDILAFVNDKYMEITQNYYFRFLKGNKTKTSFTIPNIKEILISLKKDVIKYRNEKKRYYKSLKRLNSWYKLQNKVNDKLLSVINSDYGRKAVEMSDYENLLYVIKNKKLFNIDDINKANPDNLTKKQIENKIQQLDKEINSKELLKIIKQNKLY